jgi:hypothetical protein
MADGRPCVPNEFGLWGPSADGRPARRMNSASRGLRPTVGLRRPGGMVFASAEADAWRASALEGRFQSAGGPSADGRPVPTEKRSLRRRRPTPGAERLRRPISIGVEAFGRWSACADREGVFCVGEGRRLARSALEGRFQSAWRPSAGGRPAPTGRVSFALAEADAWRASASEGRFQSAWRPSAGGRPAPTGRCLLRWRRPTPGAQAPWKADFNRREGLRPMVGLRRPGGGLLRWRRPTPGAQAPLKADFNRREGLRPAVGLRRPKGWSLRRRRPTLGAQAPWKADFNRRGGLRPTVGLRRPGGGLLRRRRPTPGAER